MRLERDAVLRPTNEILLQKIVGHRGLNFDARKQRIERRRHHLARAEGRRPDEDDLVFESAGVGQAAQHVRSRDVGEGALGASIAHQQIALAIERHGQAVEHQRRRVDVEDAERDVARAGGRGDGRQGERGIDTTVELQQQRNPSQEAVGIGRGVQKSRGAGRLRQDRKAADRTCRSKEVDRAACSSPRRMMARPSGCCAHALGPLLVSSNVNA